MVFFIVSWSSVMFDSNVLAGFRMNPSSWKTFLQKTLKDAVYATDECFVTVKK